MQYVWLLLATTLLSVKKKKKHNKWENQKCIFLQVVAKYESISVYIRAKWRDLKRDIKYIRAWSSGPPYLSRLLFKESGFMVLNGGHISGYSSPASECSAEDGCRGGDAIVRRYRGKAPRTQERAFIGALVSVRNSSVHFLQKFVPEFKARLWHRME